MSSYFRRFPHEIDEGPVRNVIESELVKSILYFLPVRWSSLPPQDHGTNIDAAIAIGDSLEEVHIEAHVCSKQRNGGI